MCGLAGCLHSRRDVPADELQATASRMAGTLCHRGPDGSGAWVDAEAGIALGHRRLSIIDLSEGGSQPMISSCGRYVVAYNGEIYNFEELRCELNGKGHRFRGESDTEVMLAAVTEWGLRPAVERFIGMFAFAMWDRKEQVLHLVRDRLGIKPLYYGWAGDAFLFGSELKGMRAHPCFNPTISRDALALFLRHNYIPAPYSIYEGVFKLPPATMLAIDGRHPQALSQPDPYWCARRVAEQGLGDPYRGSVDDAAEELDALLRDAVKRRMVSDVPLGALLSGGIDSSTVVALMQSQSERPVKTYTIGFHEAGFNEAEEAAKIAAHLGTDHTELYVTPEEAMGVIPRLPAIYDEPFSDSSQIPTLVVSELARCHVTVALSGDGGDELFCGYNIYGLGREIRAKVNRIPGPVRRVAAAAIKLTPSPVLDRGFSWFAPTLNKYGRPGTVGDKMHEVAGFLTMGRSEDMHLRLVSHWRDAATVVKDASEVPTRFTGPIEWGNLTDLSHRMMYLDTVTYLPDDILTKVDRASMSAGLEVRVPLLDHRVAEFAWKLPLSMKVRDGQNKWILRQVLDKYVPRELYDRPKKGFAMPVGDWLRGPLRDWAEELLNEDRLKREGFFEPGPILRKWSDHISGKRDWWDHLWDVLMFQAWLQEQRARL